MALLTVGHSNHTIGRFLTLLGAQGVELVADIRSVPHSTRHPQFSRPALAEALTAAGVSYRHFPDLGGKRAVAFSHHMDTPRFRRSLDQLLGVAADKVVVAMCAEADPWQCHRRLLADAASARGVNVVHLLADGSTRNHEYHPSLFDGGK